MIHMKSKTNNPLEINCVVKRGKNNCHTYDERKVYGSVYSACYIVTFDHKQCEKIADSISKQITRAVHKKKTVTSTWLFHQIINLLKKHNKHAAFMYETHRDIA